MKKNNFYAYLLLDTNEKGITTKWPECQKKVSGQNARYKKFSSENEAKDWINNGAEYDVPIGRAAGSKNSKKKTSKINNIILENGIYFDAGTGRGIGVEVRVTDKHKTSLVHKFRSSRVNEFDNIHLGDVTNNFGELYGCYLALTLAIKTDEKKIFGDSKLVIEYWSKGICKRADLPEKTVKLIDKVKVLRKKFYELGGEIKHVSGDINPADLGFHR